MRASDLNNDQLIQKLESGKKWLTENVHAVGKSYNSDKWEMNLRIFAQIVDEAEKRGIKFDTNWFIPLIFQDRETGAVPEWIDKPRPTIKSITTSGKYPCFTSSSQDQLC